MVRRLMQAIITEEKLQKMTPKGKRNYSPVPSHIFEAVECEKQNILILFKYFLSLKKENF